MWYDAVLKWLRNNTYTKHLIIKTKRTILKTIWDEPIKNNVLYST